MAANVKGALIISLAYLAMIAGAVVATFYFRKAAADPEKKSENRYDLADKIISGVFKELFRK